VFAAAAGLAVRRGGGISCRCFGGLGAGTVLGPRTLLRPFALAAVAWARASRAPVSWDEALASQGCSVRRQS
jgi:hypothetical protein